MTRKQLDDATIAAELTELSGWQRDGHKLCNEFKFGSFSEAFGFMTSVALVAERLDHHPEWFNVYNRVKVELTTHDAGGISGLDFQLAREIDRLAQRFA